jgi:hypothetical protein
VTTLMPLVSEVAEIPGESEVAWFNPETGKIEPLLEVPPATAPEPREQRVDPAKLRLVLAAYFDDEALRDLAGSYQLNFDLLPGADRAARVAALVSYCQEHSALWALLRDAHAAYRRRSTAAADTS